jgi:hypothetical protein
MEGAMVSPHDRDILRRLAGEAMEIAQQPVQQERINGWKAINGLQPHRPMVWITEIPFGEVMESIPELQRRCEDEDCRSIEGRLRMEIFRQKALETDEVMLPQYTIGMKIDGRGFGVEVQEKTIAQGESYIQSHDYEPVIKGPEDLDKIQMPTVSCDKEWTERNAAFASEIFGDLLPVVVQGCAANFFPAWDLVIRWTGVTEALMDMAMRPDYIHALMQRVTDGQISIMEQMEEKGLLSASPPAHRVGSGGAGFTDELPRPDADPARIRTIDQWGGATPQIFSDVSPAMHEEFALQYESQWMARSGLNYYGCCEPLHNKMHLLAKAPRIRKISISPWCDVGKAHDNAEERYVFSHKPNPAAMATDTFNAEAAEAEIRQRFTDSGEMPCEIIMKDISTIRGDFTRVQEWCRIASRVAREFG